MVRAARRAAIRPRVPRPIPKTGKSAGGAGPNSGAGEGDAPPEDFGEEAANKEYAEKATDLALEYLEDQMKKRRANQELLDRLGWSQQDLQRLPAPMAADESRRQRIRQIGRRGTPRTRRRPQEPGSAPFTNLDPGRRHAPPIRFVRPNPSARLPPPPGANAFQEYNKSSAPAPEARVKGEGWEAGVFGAPESGFRFNRFGVSPPFVSFRLSRERVAPGCSAPVLRRQKAFPGEERGPHALLAGETGQVGHDP